MTSGTDPRDALHRQALVQLVPRVCHKLNNVVSVIQGLAELVSRRELDDRSRSQVETILEQAGTAARQVGALGEFAAERGMGRELTDVATVVAATRDLLEPVTQVQRLRFDLRPAHDVNLVEVDARRLSQAVVTAAVTGAVLSGLDAAEIADEARVLRVSVVRSERTVAIRVTRPAAPEEHEANRVELLDEVTGELDARSSKRTYRGWTCERVALVAAT